jgi:hypothetical protein
MTALSSTRRLPRVRTRRRFARSLARARWSEYRTLLATAIDQRYQLISLESWLADPDKVGAADVMLLRHDVDQYPASALRMAAIEQDLGVRSTWYFRWRTAHPEVVRSIRNAGHEVGLHYETLTRELLRRGLRREDAASLVPEARSLLREELAAFAELHGPVRSTCPHGDTRMPGVHNGVLLQGEDLAAYGVRWEANAAVGNLPLDVWLTDRSSAEGRWKDSLDPIDLIVDRRSPMLAVVHPNNWVSGLALWSDRLAPGRFGTADSDGPPLSRSALNRLLAERATSGLEPHVEGSVVGGS